MKWSEQEAEVILREWSEAWHHGRECGQMNSEISRCRFREILVRHLEQAVERGKKIEREKFR